MRSISGIRGPAGYAGTAPLADSIFQQSVLHRLRHKLKATEFPVVGGGAASKSRRLVRSEPRCIGALHSDNLFVTGIISPAPKEGEALLPGPHQEGGARVFTRPPAACQEECNLRRRRVLLAHLSNTRRAYAHPVGRFLAWCEEQKIKLRQVTPCLAGRFHTHYLASVQLRHTLA